jgi:hypothetical protein
MISHVGRRAVAAKAETLANTIPDHPGFHQIKTAVAAQFGFMSTYELFRTGVEKDALWTTYLTSFPPGTNPIMRQRAEHDCSCCRQFVRAIGDMVAIIDGKLTSIWDIYTGNPTYDAVATAMCDLVKARAIENRFLHTEAKVGTDKNFEDTDGVVKAWEHFFVTLPNSRVCAGKDIGPRLSDSKAAHDVLLRSLTELTMDAADTVLELIGQNSLYRGEEHRHAVTTFRQEKIAFDRLAAEDRDNFVWLKIGELPASVSKIRNTSIGQLLIDFSAGEDMEGAVRKFEAMVAPANYKRPTALVTKAMIERAKATVAELGLTSALERRYARLTDITVNNILFADRNARKAMSGGGVFDDLAATASVKPKTFDKVEEIGIEKFLGDVVPKAESIEVMVENRHVGNLVSLIAPADASAAALFKWDNRFSWSYNGDFADSIRERVKKAGGNVSGDLCCRLAWSNFDDLDFHMVEPDRNEIHFANKGPSRLGGQLDVDMNAGGGSPGRGTREPVENIFYGSAHRMAEGTYNLFVHQYAKIETADVGFEAEIDWKGSVHRFAYPKALRQGERVVVAELHYKNGNLTVISPLPMTTVSRKVWSIDTEAFHRVTVAMLSPNHWDGHGVGNKHYFFMLDGCQNDGTARGFYNEFLRADLDQHRKVLEMVGAKMRTDETVNQLSGLGFSSTQRNHVIARVKGAFSRTLKVTF